MHRRLFTCCLSLLLLSGCQSGSPASSSKVRTAAKAYGLLQGSKGPSMLQAPTDAVRLQGTVALDAGYAVDKAGGKLLGEGDARAAAPEGGKLSGSNVISNDGSSVVASGAGNVIVDDASSLIGNDGGSVVASGAGNLVASGAGNVVASGGGNLLAQAPAFRLAAVSGLEPGQQLPAVGMVVQIRTLRDDKRVPLGIDAQGKQVYAIYTNLQGKFEVFLPRTVAENVRVLVTPRKKVDRRLNYAAIAMTKSPVVVDEDSTIAAGYIQASIAGRLAQIISRTPEELSAMAPVFGKLDARLAAAAVTGQVAELPEAERKALADKLARNLLATVDLSEAKFEDADGNQVACLPAVTEIMAITRTNMAHRMAELRANGEDPGAVLAVKLEGAQIQKPADFVDFLVTTQMEHLEENELARFARIHALVLAAGLESDDARMLRLAAGSNGILTHIGASLADARSVTDAALNMLRQGGR